MTAPSELGLNDSIPSSRRRRYTWSVGDLVVVRGESRRADGIHAGTRGVVLSYVVTAGAVDQVVRVQLRSKGRGIALFAPCELAPDQGQTSAAAPAYDDISREQFLQWMRSRQRVTLRVLSTTQAGR